MPVNTIPVSTPGNQFFVQSDSRPKGSAVTPAHLQRFTTASLPPGTPAGIAQTAIVDPNLFLSQAIQGQTINSMIVLEMTASQFLNIPFISSNAVLANVDAIFWIEKIAQPTGSGEFMQLQYSQNITLTFDQIEWPHISVGTLVKQ
jgi:hypothetical protein